MTAFVDVQFIDGLALPYVEGAETALFAPDLNPAFGAAWDALVTTFPGLTLQPLFDQQPVEELADILDAIRLRGEEPPDLFAWFTVPCDDAVVDDVVPALQALPMVVVVSARPSKLPATLVSYGTNPDTNITLQIQPAPNGVDAIYAWNVAGGTGDLAEIVDVEFGWNTTHEELLTARIRSPGGFIADTIPKGGHGTAVAGILVGADNGVGTIGVVPGAQLTLVADNAVIVGDSVAEVLLAQQFSTAAAVAAALKQLGPGGVVLIEEGTNFFARPPTPDGNPDLRPDILVEFDLPVQAAIRLAALFGIIVVEPAGNGGVNLDNFPFLAHTRAGAPTFSHAIVVGAGELKQPKLDAWERTFSSFGSRVDCFAAGALVRAPSSDGSDQYLLFGGTSSASAVIAGAVAAVQSMAIEHDGEPIDAINMRRLFRDPDLGITIPPQNKGGIGAMPSLRKIARAKGWPRILPVGAAATTGDAAFMVHLDDNDRVVRRHWTFFTDWSAPVPLLPPFDGFSVTACQPAVLSTIEQDPVARLVHEAYLVGPGGVHHLFFDSIGTFKDLAFSIAPVPTVAQGRSLAAVRAAIDRVVISAISPEGKLVVMTGDPDALAGQLTNPLVIDDVGFYRRIAGPAIVSRTTAHADVVAIEDGGALTWFTGTTVATIGTGWTKGPPEPTATEFDPGARPALLAVDDVLVAAAVGSEGWLRVTTIDPAVPSIDAPAIVDVQVAIANLGPVALARAGNNLVVLAVDVDNRLVVATRAVAGGDWTALAPVESLRAVSPLGGVTAVSLSDVGVLAIVVAQDGTLMSALSGNGTLWPRLQAMP